MLLRDRVESCNKDTVVMVVSCLKSATLSLFVGKLSNCVKIVSLISPVIDYLTQLYIALEFLITLSFVRAVLAELTSSSVME